jgi:nucleoside-diphosphate-sugar epimerase
MPAFWAAATAPQASREIINLGGTTPTTILEAANLCREVMRGGEIEFVEPRHEVSQAWSTWSKSVELLGYADRTPLVDGLASMWSWAQDAWYEYPERRGTSSNIRLEIERGLYSFWQNNQPQGITT